MGSVFLEPIGYGTFGWTVRVKVVKPAAGVAEPVGVVAEVHAANRRPAAHALAL